MKPVQPGEPGEPVIRGGQTAAVLDRHGGESRVRHDGLSATGSTDAGATLPDVGVAKTRGWVTMRKSPPTAGAASANGSSPLGDVSDPRPVVGMLSHVMADGASPGAGARRRSSPRSLASNNSLIAS